MNPMLRRISSVLASLVLLLSCASAPATVHAQVATAESNPTTLLHFLYTAAKTTATAASSAATAASSGALVTKEYALDPFVFALSQSAIQSLTRSTVNWINSGFQGSPAYATDLQGTLQDAADQTANQFVTQFQNNLHIASPFRSSVGQNVLKNYYLSTSNDGFFLQNPYTLNQVSSNDKAFLNGDFSKGGFSAWLSASINPQNNPFGALNAAESELASRVAGARSQVQQELGWGNGFLSWRKCDVQGPSVQDNTQTDTIPIVTQGPDGKYVSTGQTTTGATTVTSLTQKQTCLSSHIETPGSVIANQINHSLGLGADSLVNAKEFDEIVNALMGQLMKNVLGDSGLFGLSRGSTATGGRPYFDQTAASNTAGAGVADNFLQMLASKTTDLKAYIANWQTIADAANTAKNAVASCPSGQATIDAQITPVLTQASTAISNAQTGVDSISKIQQTVLQAAGSSTGTVDTSNATQQFNDLQKTLPDPNAIAYAQTQSQDSLDASSPTLYTQMQSIAASGCTP